MPRSVPYPRQGAKTEVEALATRLLLLWDGPHRVTRVLGTTHCEIEDCRHQSLRVLNFSRLLRYVHFRPNNTRADRKAIPQAAMICAHGLQVPTALPSWLPLRPLK